MTAHDPGEYTFTVLMTLKHVLSALTNYMMHHHFLTKAEIVISAAMTMHKIICRTACNVCLDITVEIIV